MTHTGLDKCLFSYDGGMPVHSDMKYMVRQ